jgi:tRNA(fMet)-specific endonuclease VapC
MKKFGKKQKRAKRAGKKMCLSTISYYETKRGLLATQATQKMKQFDLICQKYEMLGIDSEKVLDEASQIYANLKRRGELLPDADILIAAIFKPQVLYW